MAIDCDKCNTKILDKEYLACIGCEKKYHLDCCSFSEKLFRIMTKERKSNWQCRLCLAKKGKPTNNVTQRKRRQAVSPSETCDTIDTSANETMNRSCPENCTNLQEDIEELKTKIMCLETKLESADIEIERLLAENYKLNEIIANRDSKINQLTRICRSTPQRINNVEDTKSSSNRIPESPESPESISPILPKTNKTTVGVLNARTTGLNIKQVSTTQRQAETLSLANTDNPCTPQILPRTEKNKIIYTPKICLISTNKYNKTSKIARRTLESNYDICHYLLPYRGIRQLLNDIESKLAGFTHEDYCIVLIGEEDFNSTENYHELVLYIRQKIQNVTHTTVILCSPTFKQGRNNDMFNARIEAFNHLLDKDVIAHEYAYLIDSNLHLNYDLSMFRRISGALNNEGLKQVFEDVKVRITNINNWLTNSNSALHTTSIQTSHTHESISNSQIQTGVNNQNFRSH